MGRGKNDGAEGFWERFSELSPKDSAVAAGIGVPTSTLSSLKTGNRFPPVNMAVDIARYLGVSVEYLCYGEEKNDSARNAALLSQIKKFEEFFDALESASPEVIEAVKVLVRAAARGNAAGSTDRDPGYDFPAGSVIPIPSVPAQNLENRNKREKSAEDIV